MTDEYGHELLNGPLKKDSMRSSYLTGRVYGNAGLALVESVFSAGGHALLLYFMARDYGPARFGIVTFAYTVLTFGSVVSSLGSHMYGVKILASTQDRTTAFLSSLLSFQVFNACLVFAAGAGAALFFASTRAEALFIVLLTATLPAEMCVGAVRASFYGRERFLPVVLLRAAVSMAMLGAGLAALRQGAGLLQMGALLFSFGALTAVIALVTHRSIFGPIPLRWNRAAYLDVARGSLPFFAVSVLAIVHMKVDIPMVRFLRGNAELGLYGLAASVVNVSAVVIGALTTSLFPAVARQGGRSHTLSPALALRTLVVPLILGLLTAGGLCAAARPAVDVFLGPAYRGSVLPLTILAWFLPCIFVSSTAIRMMMACGGTRTAIRILAVNCAVNIGANLVLIPWAGIPGAAAATVLSALVSALQSVHALRGWAPRPVGP
jgi:O-antigen/teichoic acid export membrane protein